MTTFRLQFFTAVLDKIKKLHENYQNIAMIRGERIILVRQLYHTSKLTRVHLKIIETIVNWATDLHDA